MRKVVSSVLRWVLQILEMYREKPKLPLESVRSPISPPKSRQTSMTQTFSESISCRDCPHPARNPPW